MKLDHRYVYIFKVPNTRKFKIGIAKNLATRQRTIERSLKKKIRLIAAYKFYFAKSVETRMHNLFRKDRRWYKGSGKTEYFQLNVFESRAARSVLFGFYMVQVVGTVLIMFILFVIVLLLN